jgi:hypothetical protein
MMMTDRCQINGRLRFCLVHRRDDTEGRKEEEWGGGTKHAVYTSIKYSQVFRPLFHSIRYPPPPFFLSLFRLPFGLMVSPSARKLTFWFPVARQLATAAGRVAHGHGYNKTLTVAILAIPQNVCPKNKTIRNQQRDTTFQLSPLSCRFTLTEISKPFIYNLTQFFFFIAQVTPIHSFIQSLLVDIWWFHLV